ncbi:MAG: winged helix-turn-helix domain-containing protein [Pseudohongiellaceae bacterium]
MLNLMGRIKENCIYLGHFQVFPDSCRIRCKSRFIPLEQKSMDVLLFLAMRPGEIIPRSEILGAIWPNIAAGDQALNRCVSNLRKALNDCADAPSIIETVPHKGYRLIAECRPASIPIETKRADRLPLGIKLKSISLLALLTIPALLLGLATFLQNSGSGGQRETENPIRIISSPAKIIYVAPTLIPSEKEHLSESAVYIKTTLIELFTDANFVVLASDQPSATIGMFSTPDRQKLVTEAGVGYFVAAELLPMASKMSVRFFMIDATSEDVLWHQTFDIDGDIPAADLRSQLQDTLLVEAAKILRQP